MYKLPSDEFNKVKDLLFLQNTKGYQLSVSNTDDIEIKKSVKAFLTDKTQSDIPDRWQRLNLSTEKAKNILTKLK